MRKRFPGKSVLFDLLAGLLALIIVLVGFVSGVLGQNLRTQLIVVSTLFLCAGLIRAAASPPPNPWLTACWVDLGSTIPLLVLAFTGVAFTSRPHLFTFLTTSLLAAVAGTHVGRFWQLGRTWTSTILSASWLFTTLSVALLLVPILLAKFSTKCTLRPVPAFSFTSSAGDTVTGKSLRGRVVVLAFWATWCPPCRDELPKLNALSARYRNNPDVAFLAVDSEHEDDLLSSAKSAKAFFAKAKLSMPLVISDVATGESLHVEALPTLLIIDRLGNIRLIHSGYDGAEDLEGIVDGQIESLLRGPSRNSRKTGTVSSAPPKGLRSSSAIWRRAAAPFALPKTSLSN